MHPVTHPSNVNNDIQATLLAIQQQLEQQQKLVQQQQARIQQLETANLEQDGKVVYKNPRRTTLKLYPELVE
ncbi:hypothetical protein BGW39_000281 [Mortierella sp. 14UC]|nr:hypothetical protein BGW39_000281 [Mortierella sp. 14UC]